VTSHPGTGPIRTPDQRLRVFVSSTLKELADERKAARAAIERLRLAPVMFELGARPHPPRDLYRAYLEQSDVFVGVYGQKYGWVAPGEDVSGLEDEYNLTPAAMPRLMYIKDTGGEREPRLRELLERIRTDDMGAFKYFGDAGELGELLQSDLAILLAERFDQSRQAPPAPEGEELRRPSVLPAPLTQLIGREDELARIRELLARPSVRMVTLVGPGGIGKSRLAIDVATAESGSFPGGVVFVPLAPVDDAAVVPAAVAQALGVRDTGGMPLEDKLVTALRHRRALLVLDNFEQVLDAAPFVVALLEAAPQLKVLITSRALLRVSGELSFEVGPLRLPSGRRSRRLPASVELFVERARAVKPDFELTPDNLDAVERICVALEGVPLALELAASRIRILSPAVLLERLDRQLILLVGGRRDLPPRQQALRSTIEWSTQLLGADEKSLLAALGVFAGQFSLEAVEQAGSDGGSSDVLTLLGPLVDNSLVRQVDRDGRTYFTLLATVREYALEQLTAAGRLAELRARHARYYAGLADRMEGELAGPGQGDAVTVLRNDNDNLRAAARHLLQTRDWDTAAHFIRRLFLYWWLGGLLGEVRGWAIEMLDSGDQLSDPTRGLALYTAGVVTYWQGPTDQIVPQLTESAELWRRRGDADGEAQALTSLGLALVVAEPDPAPAVAALQRSATLFRAQRNDWGEGIALATLGRVHLLHDNLPDALPAIEEALRLVRRSGNGFALTIALNHYAWACLIAGRIDTATPVIREALHFSQRVGHLEGLAYGLEALLAVAAARGDVERAGMLFGAALTLREQTGFSQPANFSFHQRIVDGLRSGDHAEAFQRGVNAGRMLSPEEAIAVEGIAAGIGTEGIGTEGIGTEGIGTERIGTDDSGAAAGSHTPVSGIGGSR
jgi:predicted ATPase